MDEEEEIVDERGKELCQSLCNILNEGNENEDEKDNVEKEKAKEEEDEMENERGRKTE